MAKRKTPYKDKNGQTKYTCSQKIAYHKEMADKEMRAGNASKAIRHGVLAKKNADKLQKFMAYNKADRDRIVRGEKPQGKPKFD